MHHHCVEPWVVANPLTNKAIWLHQSRMSCYGWLQSRFSVVLWLCFGRILKPNSGLNRLNHVNID